MDSPKDQPAVAVASADNGSSPDEALRTALEDANLPTLLLVLHRLTGDGKWINDPYLPSVTRGLGDNDDGGFEADVQEQIREAAFDALTAWRAGDLEPAPAPSPQRIPELLALALHEEVDPAYGELLEEEMGQASRAVDPVDPGKAADFHVLVIGAGMAGVCIGAHMRMTGIPFTIVDKNHGYGGTWLENEYPGCGVDTPSHLYSFSFARRSDWSHYFAERIQLWKYFESVADEYALREDTRFGLEVLSAEWNEDEARWHVHIRGEDGTEETLTASVVVSGVGHFNRPSIPDIKGIETFPGPVMHTAQWDNSVDVTGKRVVVVGTGASAMQLVPALAGTAEKVIVIQRSRQWAIPHPNCGRAVSEGVQYLLENVPFYAGWYRLRQFWRFGDRLHPALQVDPEFEDPDYAVNAVNASHRKFLVKYIRSELEEHPELAELSMPDYPAYGKRPLIDHGWYKTIRRDDVDVVRGSVSEVRGDVVVTQEGDEIQCDVLALATGFKTLEILGPMEVTGTSGATLRETWGEDDARAYLGMSVPDFPNLFILFGPNTSTGHGGSAFLTTEFQTRYVVQLLAAMVEQQLRKVEVRQEVHDTYNEELDDRLSRTVWTHPRVTNYYRNKAGRIVGTSPLEYIDYWGRTRRADLGDYVTE